MPTFKGFNNSNFKVSNKGRKGKTLALMPANPPLQKQVDNVKRSVKKLNNRQELKYIDSAFIAPFNPTSAGVVSLLNGCVLGDQVDQRTADQGTATSIQFRATLTQGATVINSDIVMRHIIFWDSQPNGVTPAIADLLDNDVITLYVHAPYKRQYQKRFKILHDKIHITRPMLADPAAATTEIVTPVVYTKKKISLNRVIKYNDDSNTGLVADLASNGLFSLWVSNSATASISILGGYRYYFKDD